MPSFTLNGQVYQTDKEGYLIYPGEWTEEIAEEIARIYGVTDKKTPLNKNQWEIIYFLRKYYEEYKIAPMLRIMIRAITKTLGKEKGAAKYLYKLFSKEPSKNACRIAGLPKPTGCF